MITFALSAENAIQFSTCTSCHLSTSRTTFLIFHPVASPCSAMRQRACLQPSAIPLYTRLPQSGTVMSHSRCFRLPPLRKHSASRTPASGFVRPFPFSDDRTCFHPPTPLHVVTFRKHLTKQRFSVVTHARQQIVFDKKTHEEVLYTNCPTLAAISNELRGASLLFYGTKVVLVLL